MNDAKRVSAEKSFRAFTFVISLLYGAVLCSLPNENFFDHANYLIFAENAWDQLVAFWTISPVIAIVNEPIWLLLNSALALLLEPDAVVRVIIFSSASTFALRMTRCSSKWIAVVLLMLFMPMVVKNFLIHIRQGTAIAIFMWGWFCPRPKVRWALMAISPFVHTSFAFILLLLALAKIALRLRLGPTLRGFLFGGIGVSIGLGLGWLAAVVGARQAEEYTFGASGISGLGFLIWAVIFMLMCLEGRRFLKKHSFESAIIMFYLGTYFFVEVTARIFESGIPVVLLAILQMRGWKRNTSLLVLGAVTLLQWSGRLSEPMLGFGIA